MAKIPWCERVAVAAPWWIALVFWAMVYSWGGVPLVVIALGACLCALGLWMIVFAVKEMRKK